MDPITMTFLIVGGVGLAIVLISIVVGDFLHFLNFDADGPFSLPAICAFISGGGFGGAIAASTINGRLDTAPTVLISLAAGLVLALPLSWATVRFARGLMRMNTDKTPEGSDLLGTLGTVVTSIPATGYGEVRIHVHGQSMKFNARSEIPLVAGTPIYVIGTPTATSVEVVSTADPSTDL